VLNIGCGVTAYDEGDARNILNDKVFPLYGFREILDVVKDIDVSLLDEGHVRPNMGPSSNRGVWFPHLY
jgi:hypothetical protein